MQLRPGISVLYGEPLMARVQLPGPIASGSSGGSLFRRTMLSGATRCKRKLADNYKLLG